MVLSCLSSSTQTVSASYHPLPGLASASSSSLSLQIVNQLSFHRCCHRAERTPRSCLVRLAMAHCRGSPLVVLLELWSVASLASPSCLRHFAHANHLHPDHQMLRRTSKLQCRHGPMTICFSTSCHRTSCHQFLCTELHTPRKSCSDAFPQPYSPESCQLALLLVVAKFARSRDGFTSMVFHPFRCVKLILAAATLRDISAVSAVLPS